MNTYELPEGIEITRYFERENIEQSDDIFYKILLNGEKIGFASYNLKYSWLWYINHFFINENYRRRKIGTYLLQYLIKKMRDEENIHISIHPVKTEREELIPFLIKNNFQEQRYGNYLLYPDDEQ